jgi:hypothetical protein
VAGYAAGTDDAVAILMRISAAAAPHTNRYSVLCGYLSDLIFGTDQRDLGIERRAQRAHRDLGANTAWISQRHGNARRCDLSRPYRPLAYCSGQALPGLPVRS